MQFIFYLILAWICWKILAAIFRYLAGSSASAPPRARSEHRTPHVGNKRPTHVYRPTARSKTTTAVKFRTGGTGHSAQSQSAAADLSGINDAFTGKRLDLSHSIYECIACHVYYQSSSVEVLREANSSRCMACGSTRLVQYGARRDTSEARNFTPDTVTLENFRQHYGRVITFTGYVHEVKSGRNATFAVMFEKRSWVMGLKMVAFRGGVRKIGGAAKLLSYAGRTLTIRGLLIEHPKFGPEIIVDDPSMILRVQ